jgi:hypothetical protein
VVYNGYTNEANANNNDCKHLFAYCILLMPTNQADISFFGEQPLGAGTHYQDGDSESQKSE